MIPKPAVRVVLDTNVCLDLFVFHDPRWAMLLAALRDGSIEAVTRDDCRREWQIVLGYSHLPLDETSRAASEAEFDALIRCVPLADYVAPEMRLPVCKDTDDQKFLETAFQVQADILITKDKALLKLARRSVKLDLYAILRPDAWVALQMNAPT
jgi:putative PIN family toxin of toxin-antitoxin system